MMLCEVVLCTDLSKVIETGRYEIKNMTISEFLAAEIKNYKPEKMNFFSVILDGVKIPSDLWRSVNLKNVKSMKIVLEAEGDPFTWVAIIVTIAAAVYSAYLMHKLSATTGTDTQTGSSIYDVNAQGNKVKLNQVIPEQFGLLKRFPDYIADTHRFYRNNQRVLDLSLCQGVGQFSRSAAGNDIYFGSTPFSQMSEKIQYKVFEPGEALADNSISSELGWCWFNSTEITASGKELETPKSKTNEDELVYIFSKSIAVLDADTRIFKSKNWEVGDILKIEFPEKHVLFGDNARFRSCEWAFKFRTEPENYITEVKASIDSLESIDAGYYFKGAHTSNINLITAAEQQDPEHDTYNLISGNHYNHSGLDKFSYYDKNSFCCCWGEGYINSDSYPHLDDLMHIEIIVFPEDNWSSSAFADALVKQVIDTSSEPMQTKAIYKETYKGIHWIVTHTSSGYTYGSILDGKSLTKGQFAIWDYAPSYSSPGNNSQFWRRDDTDCFSQGRIDEVISNIKNRANTSYNAYTRIGQVYASEMEKPYTQSNYSYNDVTCYSPAYFYYCFGSVMYTLDEERKTEFYKIVEIKKVDDLTRTAYYYYNIIWGSYPPQNKTAYFFRVRKCNSEGVIDAAWKSFEQNYTVEKGADYEEDDDIIQGINITVFDHVD